VYYSIRVGPILQQTTPKKSRQKERKKERKKERTRPVNRLGHSKSGDSGEDSSSTAGGASDIVKMESSGEDPRATGGLVSNLLHPRINNTKQHTLESSFLIFLPSGQ